MPKCPDCKRDFKNGPNLDWHRRFKHAGQHEPTKSAKGRSTMAEGCLDCVRKENELALKDRDLKDLQEERDYIQKNSQTTIGQLKQQLEQSHQGHQDLDALLACPDCGPGDDRAKVEAARKLAPKAFEPLKLGK